LGTSTLAEQPGQGLRISQHLGGVCHLRRQPRRHERSDLDLALACGHSLADPFFLALGGQDRLQALKAVAQPYLPDDGMRWLGHGDRLLMPLQGESDGAPRA
jgi:hypothetical protein